MRSRRVGSGRPARPDGSRERGAGAEPPSSGVAPGRGVGAGGAGRELRRSREATARQQALPDAPRRAGLPRAAPQAAPARATRAPPAALDGRTLPGREQQTWKGT